MPLRDHFRSPLDDVHAWDELHGMWPAMIVRELVQILPEPYFAAPGVHLGTAYEIDIGTYCESSPEPLSVKEEGESATFYTAPTPTLTLEPTLPQDDIYEVRIYDSRRNRRLVATIELVSPSNKHSPESRATFVSKVAELLKQDICVSIVDVVSTRHANLYTELLSRLQSHDPAVADPAPGMYAVTSRLRCQSPRPLMDNWYYPLTIGQPLPSLPIWLTADRAISLPLEASYEETCRTLRIC